MLPAVQLQSLNVHQQRKLLICKAPQPDASKTKLSILIFNQFQQGRGKLNIKFVNHPITIRCHNHCFHACTFPHFHLTQRMCCENQNTLQRLKNVLYVAHFLASQCELRQKKNKGLKLFTSSEAWMIENISHLTPELSMTARQDKEGCITFHSKHWKCLTRTGSLKCINPYWLWTVGVTAFTTQSQEETSSYQINTKV